MNRLTLLLIPLLLVLPTRSLAQVAPEDLVVASWHETSVSLADFRQSYMHYWQATHLPDSPELRKQVARQLLEQRLIANQARKRSLHTHPGIQKRLKRDLNQFIRTKYVEEEVRNQVDQPGADEIEQAVAWQQKRYFVRQLFSLTREGIDSLQARLDAGEDFITLATTTLPDPVMAATGGTLGWIAWGESDLPVEGVLFELDHGDTSAPVESLMGWHILRVDSVEQTLAFGKPDPMVYQDTRSRLYNRRFDMIAAKHIREFVWQHELAIDTNVLRSLWQSLAPRLPSQPNQMPQALDLLAETPPVDVASQVVAYVDGTPFYARQFFDALPNLPRGYLGPNLKQALEIAIRDSLLAHAGMEKGYHTAKDVVSKLHRAEDTYLFTAMMQQAADSARRAPTDLERYYMQNRSRYIKYVGTEVWEILMAHPDSALALVKAIDAGLDFKAMAREHTLRDSTRDEGGYLGFVRSDAGPIGARAATLLPGALYGPIHTEAGYSLIQTGIRVPHYYALEDVRDRVQQDYEQALYTSLYANMLPPSYTPEDVLMDVEALENAYPNQEPVPE